MRREQENKRRKIVIDRDKEMRTEETSRMIDEGGLGSRTYYDIEKIPLDKRKELEKQK